VAALIVAEDHGDMAKVTNIDRARNKKKQAKTEAAPQHVGFVPCSQDMTICGDCADNRENKKCPRMKEWFAQGKT
jgi:hypothetical protein